MTLRRSSVIAELTQTCWFLQARTQRHHLKPPFHLGMHVKGAKPRNVLSTARGLCRIHTYNGVLQALNIHHLCK